MTAPQETVAPFLNSGWRIGNSANVVYNWDIVGQVASNRCCLRTGGHMPMMPDSMSRWLDRHKTVIRYIRQLLVFSSYFIAAEYNKNPKLYIKSSKLYIEYKRAFLIASSVVK